MSLHWQAHQFNQQTSYEEVVLWGEHPLFMSPDAHRPWISSAGLLSFTVSYFVMGFLQCGRLIGGLSRLHLSAQAAGSAENNAGIWGERTCECASIPVQEDQQHLQGQKR